MKLSKTKIVIRYLMLAAVCCIIFWFSANNGDMSTDQSNFVVDKIISLLFPRFDCYGQEAKYGIQNALAVIVRKGAHFSIYTLLGALGFAAFFQIRKFGLRYFTAVGFTFLYACTDEIHQIFVPDRTGKITDVCIDTLGGMLGALLVMLVVVLIKAAKLLEENYKSVK